MNQHWHRRQCSEDETDAAQTSITLDHGLVLEARVRRDRKGPVGGKGLGPGEALVRELKT